MIVSCSQCGVKLKIDETKIKDGGSKLKCPKCATIFPVYRPDDPSAQAAGQPQPQAAPPRPPQPPQQAAPQPQAPPQMPPQPPFQAPQPQAPQPPPRPQMPPQPPTMAPQQQPMAGAATGSLTKWELDRKKIVVAHDGESHLLLIKNLLTEAGYEVITAMEGVLAVVAIEQYKPFLSILDVALPRIYGFEICDRIKTSDESKDMKVLLIASIYDKTKYKREPESLYGADDYIEKHHIQDALVQKVQRLATGVSGPIPREIREADNAKPAPVDTPLRQQQAQQLRRDEMQEFPKPASAEQISTPSAPDPQKVEAARRFARIILSDIALYNQSAVEEGIKGGSFHTVLAAELKEGRDLYNSRVSEEIRKTMDYYEDEIQKFIEKKRNTMKVEGKI